MAGDRNPTRKAVIEEPTIPPRVPPTPMRPKSRRLWRSRKMSVMNDQKTETTNRLKTLIQTKKVRPTHTEAAPSATTLSSTK